MVRPLFPFDLPPALGLNYSIFSNRCLRSQFNDPAGNYGTYRYSPATIDDLAAVMRGNFGAVTSCIGYPQNADLIERWTGVRPDVSRTETRFAHGDQALVMRLPARVADPATKGAPVSDLPEDWEFAWVDFVGGA